MLFKNPVRTSKRAPHLTITKINWLMLFKEIIAVHSENHAKPKTDCESRWFLYLPLGLKGLINNTPYCFLYSSGFCFVHLVRILC
jgi:hypothetical protein